TTLDESDLSAHSTALAQIGSALAPGGNLQLYACDVASGATGQQFISDLSHYAGGVTVEAATHDIGLTASGENWSLDASTGRDLAPADAPFTAEAQANFQGALATTPTTEVWFVTAGATGNQQQLSRADSVNGSTTASNQTTLLVGNNSTVPFVHADDVALDTVHGLYFVVDSSGQGNPNIIERGTLAQALAGQATFTTIYTETLPANTEGGIQSIALDIPDQLVYFIQANSDETTVSLNRVGFNGGAVTTLATLSNVFLADLTLDLAHGNAYATAI